MSHAFYVYTSWGVSAVVIAIMTAAILLDGRRQKSEIKRLENAGIRRRSADAPLETPDLDKGQPS